ncbi:monovalent cation/H+ antiporter complex subunit F [Ectorhizobium quercum]|uniref:monovalent cation/H+ antiporter complex subunit F n=1 Tax=Ectorhizobium quercum TaxID=2965071 RepID=UPI00352282C8
MTAQGFLDVCVKIGLTLIVLSIAVGFIRLRRGPLLADRMIALDMMTAAIIAFCAIFAVQSGVGAFLDSAVALALVSFGLERWQTRRHGRRKCPLTVFDGAALDAKHHVGDLLQEVRARFRDEQGERRFFLA